MSFGHRDSQYDEYAARVVFGIKRPTCVWDGNGILSFRDGRSYREFEISGLCQACQDKSFGVTARDMEGMDERAEQDALALAGASAAEEEERSREESLIDRDRTRAEEADSYIEPPQDEPDPYAGDNGGDPP